MVLHYDFVDLYIPSSKTYVLEKGAHILLARTSNRSCVLIWLTKYIVLINIQNSDSRYIFRSIYHIVKSQSWGLRATDKLPAYSTFADMFQRPLSPISCAQPHLSLHSLRAGGVTLAAQKDMPEYLYKQHGCWKSDAVKAYIRPDVVEKLSVTKAMNL